MPPEPKHRPEPIRPYVRRRRRCLMCGTAFASSWAGERICGRCKDGHAYESAAGLPDHFG